MTVTLPSATPRMAAACPRMPKAPCVLVQMVTWPSGVPAGGGGVGLDVALVHRAGRELALDDDIGLGEALFEVAPLELEMAGDVAVHTGVIATGETLGDGAGGHGLVEKGGVVAHRVEGVEDDGEGLVLDLDEGEGFLGHVGIGSGDSSHGVALVEGLLLREAVLGEETGVPHRLAVVDHHVLHDGHVGSDDNGLHLGQGLGLAGVDGGRCGRGRAGCAGSCRAACRATGCPRRTGRVRSPCRRRRGGWGGCRQPCSRPWVRCVPQLWSCLRLPRGCRT